MPDKLEDRCAVCPELLADGYGKCDHRRCMDCVEAEHRSWYRTVGEWMAQISEDAR